MWISFSVNNGVIKHIDTLSTVTPSGKITVSFMGVRRDSTSFVTKLGIDFYGRFRVDGRITGGSKVDLTAQQIEEFFFTVGRDMANRVRNIINGYYALAFTKSSEGQALP